MKKTKRQRLCLFRIGGQLFGVEGRYTRQIITLASLSTLPGQSSELLGLFSLRGNVVALLSLKTIFAFEETSFPKHALLLQEDDAETAVAIDAFEDLIEQPHLEPLSPQHEGPWQPYALGEFIHKGEAAICLDIPPLLGDIETRLAAS